MAAKTIEIKPLTSWSFSRLNDYRTCPLKFKFKHIDKIPEPGNAAMSRGTEIHNAAERFAKGLLAKLPPELALFSKELTELRKLFKRKIMPAIVEDTWAFTADWEETKWDDWLHCWLRIKLDSAHFINAGKTLIVTDWKTGKYNEKNNAEYSEQLELYALAALLLFPHVEKVLPRLCYIDHGITYPKPEEAEAKGLVFTREDIPGLKKIWADRVKPMFSDKKFAARPNNNCKWCYYGKSKKASGGPGLCKY